MVYIGNFDENSTFCVYLSFICLTKPKEKSSPFFFILTQKLPHPSSEQFLGVHPYVLSSLSNFDSKLGWFSRQVLFEWKPTFEGNHALIHTLLSERMVIFDTFVTNLVHTWSHMT